MNLDSVTPTMIVIGIVTFAVLFYLFFYFTTKDMSKEEIDYKQYIYAAIPSLLLSIGIVYGYESFKPKNNERLTGGFYN